MDRRNLRFKLKKGDVIIHKILPDSIVRSHNIYVIRTNDPIKEMEERTFGEFIHFLDEYYIIGSGNSLISLFQSLNDYYKKKSLRRKKCGLVMRLCDCGKCVNCEINV